MREICFSELEEGVVCPRCHSLLDMTSTTVWHCTGSDCRQSYPLVDGIPILINEENSVFRIEDLRAHKETYFSKCKTKTRYLPRPTLPEVKVSRRNFIYFQDLLLNSCEAPRVLVLGASIIGAGLDAILFSKKIRYVETDISFGPRTRMIADAHSIPFIDASFDGVIAQAVLEHVADPYQCVNEIYRVLKSQGKIYADTPFLQQVHGGAYDFTRFTYRGHRRLFRHFKELKSGASLGPGAALAWAWQHFMDNLTHVPPFRKILNAIAKSTSFWIKYLDPYLLTRPGSYDAASSFYFIGEKSDTVLSDYDLVHHYPVD
ncbi:MAG: methyltransferase domain-containing protein [Verrucomicrobiae bacterium]|nr:methyltransferase domain-containing protein [Verrucomicrobiae bacterium]